MVGLGIRGLWFGGGVRRFAMERERWFGGVSVV